MRVLAQRCSPYYSGVVPYESSTVQALVASWMRSLRARKRSLRTMGNYAHTARTFTAWCHDHDRPTDPAEQTSADVEAWFAHQFDHGAASSSASLRFACLKQWFGWLKGEGEIASSPMAGLKPPKIVNAPVPVLTDSDLQRLLADCAGTHWTDRRDLAIIRLFVDSGMRLGELAGITVAELDLDCQTVIINGKTGSRLVPFGDKTTEAIDRYIRARARRPQASAPALWIGIRGSLSGDGIAAMLRTAAGGSASSACIRTCSATASLTDGSPTVARNRISPAWPAGPQGRPCCPATARPQPQSGPGTHTSAWHPETRCDRGRAVRQRGPSTGRPRRTDRRPGGVCEV